MASRLLNLEVASTTSQTVATGGLVSLGNIVRKYCCKDVRGIPTFSFTGGGQSLTLNQAGYYDVTFAVTLTGGEAGEASLGLMANGIAVPYATTKATIGTALTEVHTLFLTAIVRVLPNAPVTITISNGGVPVTATMTNLKAIKIG